MAYVYPAPTWQQELLYNFATNRLLFDFNLNSAKANLTSVSLQLRKANGDAIGGAVSMSVTAARASYTLDTTTVATWPIGQNYIADMTVVASGTTSLRRAFFDICYTVLFPLVNEDTMERFDPLLNNSLPTSETTFEKYAGAAWSYIMAEVRAIPLRPALILESSQLVEPHTYLTAAYFCDAQSQTTGDVWERRMEDYWEEYNRLINKILSTLKYDAAEDGEANEGLTNAAALVLMR